MKTSFLFRGKRLVPNHLGENRLVPIIIYIIIIDSVCFCSVSRKKCWEITFYTTLQGKNRPNIDWKTRFYFTTLVEVNENSFFVSCKKLFPIIIYNMITDFSFVLFCIREDVLIWNYTQHCRKKKKTDPILKTRFLFYNTGWSKWK